MNKKIYIIIFGIIWVLFSIAAFLTISDSNSQYNYIFYVAIGMILLVGIIFVVSFLKKNPNEEHEETIDDKIMKEIEKKHPIINKIENTAIYVKGIRFIVAGSIAGFAALIKIVFLLLSLNANTKLSEILFDVVGIVMFAFASFVFLFGGIKNIKKSKNNKNDYDNM